MTPTDQKQSKMKQFQWNWKKRELFFLLLNLVSIWSLPSLLLLRSLRKKVRRSERSYGNHFPAIVAIAAKAITDIELDRCRCDRWGVVSIWSMWSLNFCFLSNRSDHMENGLKLLHKQLVFFLFVSSFTTSVCTPGFTTSVGVPCDPVQREWTRNSGNG